MSTQLKLLHDLWKTAGRQDTPLIIPCGDATSARRLRFTLYNAVKPIKDGRLVDAELKAAVENCSIGFAEGDEGSLVIGQRIKTKLMQELAGMIAPELKNGPAAMLKEDADIAAGQAALLKLMGEDKSLTEMPAGTRATPYYTR